MGSECSNINNRQLYIDWLKGFCILLVIMGHVIAWMYSDFDVLLKASSDGFNLLWKLIYSFHMPLFMFCSGIFIVKPKGWYCLKNVSTVLNKRFCSLVIPFFCMGGVVSFLSRPLFDYWYLMSLFEFSVITCVLFYITSKLPMSNSMRSIVEVIAMIVISLLLEMMESKFSDSKCNLIFKIDHLGLYKYLVLGILYSKFDIKSIMTDKRYADFIYTIPLILYVATFVLKMHGLYFYRISDICSICAITFICSFALNHVDTNSKTSKFICWLGVHSLEIYLLHFFFMTKFYFIGDMTQELFCSAGISTAFVFQFIMTIVITCVIIFMCYLAMNILNKSKLLSLICLGRMNK